MDVDSRQTGVSIQHAMNGGERRVDGMKVDGVDDYGCIFMGDRLLPKGRQSGEWGENEQAAAKKLTTRSPAFGTRVTQW